MIIKEKNIKNTLLLNRSNYVQMEWEKTVKLRVHPLIITEIIRHTRVKLFREKLTKLIAIIETWSMLRLINQPCDPDLFFFYIKDHCNLKLYVRIMHN